MIWVMDRALQWFKIVCSRWSPGHHQSGGMGIRTPDIQLAKLALYQLSYTPMFSGCSHGCGWGGMKK